MFDYSLKALTQKLKNPAETSKTQKEEKKEKKNSKAAILMITSYDSE